MTDTIDTIFYESLIDKIKMLNYRCQNTLSDGTICNMRLFPKFYESADGYYTNEDGMHGNFYKFCYRCGKMEVPTISPYLELQEYSYDELKNFVSNVEDHLTHERYILDVTNPLNITTEDDAKDFYNLICLWEESLDFPYYTYLDAKDNAIKYREFYLSLEEQEYKHPDPDSKIILEYISKNRKEKQMYELHKIEKERRIDEIVNRHNEVHLNITNEVYELTNIAIKEHNDGIIDNEEYRQRLDYIKIISDKKHDENDRIYEISMEEIDRL